MRPIRNRLVFLYKPSYALIAWVYYVLCFPFFKKFTFFYENKLFDRLEEVLLLLLLPYVVTGFRCVAHRWWGICFLGFYAIYLLSGTWSWVGSGLPINAMILQLALEMKFPVILLGFIGAGNPSWIEDQVILLVKLFLIASIVLAVFQFGFPTLYDATFPAGAHKGVFVIPGGGVLARASGVFWFTGQLAAFTATMAAFFFLSRRKYRLDQEYILWFIIATGLLVVTFSRQEIVGFAVSLAAVLLLRHRSTVVGEKYIVFMVLLGLFVIITLGPLLPYLKAVVAQLGLDDPANSETARVVFYVTGVELGTDHFPFGVGFGGFGGYAASFFDSPIYAEMGFHHYFWYQSGKYMTDTFWPHVIAESGWLGLTAYGASVCALLKGLIGLRGDVPLAELKYVYISIFSMVFLISVSITSANLTSPFSILLGGLFLGVLGKRGKSASEK